MESLPIYHAPTMGAAPAHAVPPPLRRQRCRCQACGAHRHSAVIAIGPCIASRHLERAEKLPASRFVVAGFSAELLTASGGLHAISRHSMQQDDAAEGPAGAPTAGPAAAAAQAATTILDLPEDVYALIYSCLPSARDLAACMATCRAWRASAASPVLWEAAARRRWRHGWDGAVADSIPAAAALLELQRQGHWQQAYAARRRVRNATCRMLPGMLGWSRCPLAHRTHVNTLGLPPVLQLDAAAVALLGRLAWPDQQEAARQEAHASLAFPLVQDCLHRLVQAADQLRIPPAAPTDSTCSGSGSGGGGIGGRASEDAAAGGEWAAAAAAFAAAPCSTAFWARWLHEELQVRHVAAQLRRHAAWAQAAEDELERRAGAAAATAAAAAAAGAAGEGAGDTGGVAQQAAAGGGAEPAAQQRQQQQQGQQQQQQQQGQQEQQPPADPAQLSDAELRSRLALVLEEGALALAAVHRPFAGKPLPGAGAALLLRPRASPLLAAWPSVA